MAFHICRGLLVSFTLAALTELAACGRIGDHDDVAFVKAGQVDSATARALADAAQRALEDASLIAQLRKDLVSVSVALRDAQRAATKAHGDSTDEGQSSAAAANETEKETPPPPSAQEKDTADNETHAPGGSAQEKAAEAILDASKEVKKKKEKDGGATPKERIDAALGKDDPLGNRRDVFNEAQDPKAESEPFEQSELERQAASSEKKVADAVSKTRKLAAEARVFQNQAAVQLGEDLAKTKATAKNQMAAAVGKAATFVAEAARHGDPDAVLKLILDAYNEEMKTLEAEGPTYGLDPFRTTHTTTPKPLPEKPDSAKRRAIELVTKMTGIGENGDDEKKDIMTEAAAMYNILGSGAAPPCSSGAANASAAASKTGKDVALAIAGSMANSTKGAAKVAEAASPPASSDAVSSSLGAPMVPLPADNKDKEDEMPPPLPGE